MHFLPNPSAGVTLVDPPRFPDSRGSFSRLWCQEEFQHQGFPFLPAQLNLARTREAGTIRGLHYQKAPHPIAKLVTCLKGSIFDVILDLRPESATYLKWQGVLLSGDAPQMLLVPIGFAHGYQTLEAETEVLYLIDGCHHPAAEAGLRWNDPRFGIEWKGTPTRVLSPRDENWPDFTEPEPPAPARPATTMTSLAAAVWNGSSSPPRSEKMPDSLESRLRIFLAQRIGSP